MIISPLPGLEEYFHFPFSPTAFAVGYIMTPAQAGFRACRTVILTLMPLPFTYHGGARLRSPLLSEEGARGWWAFVRLSRQ